MCGLVHARPLTSESGKPTAVRSNVAVVLSPCNVNMSSCTRGEKNGRQKKKECREGLGRKLQTQLYVPIAAAMELTGWWAFV